MGSDDPVSVTMRIQAAPRVLVVDDEGWGRRALERVLTASGYEVATAESGEAALTALSGQDFDLVLSDLLMPGLSGIELLRAIRQTDLDLPVILVTGNPSVESALAAVEYGAMRYLLKPVEPETLRRAVATGVRLRHLARLRRELVPFTGQSAKQIACRAGLEVRFENALSRLYFVYQPIVSWASRSVVGYESFVRSSEPSLADSRALFDAAERLDRLHELGRAIRQACSAPLLDKRPELSLFVNLHELELMDDRLYDDTSPLASFGSRLVLELSERARLETVKDLPRCVQRLRSRGYRIAIDDIGAGYAGLNGFSMLEPDLIKLDVGLVRDVDHALGKRRLMRSMITVCRELGVQVVAEGVETRAEFETLLDLGCELMQGYLFARPTTRVPDCDPDLSFGRDPAASA